MFIILWDVKEPTHFSLKVGHIVPGVVVCLLLCIMVGRIKKGCKLLWHSVNLTLGISGWGCAAGTLEPLVYNRASSAEFRYPILE